jgi:hypothetical protein
MPLLYFFWLATDDDVVGALFNYWSLFNLGNAADIH